MPIKVDEATTCVPSHVWTKEDVYEGSFLQLLLLVHALKRGLRKRASKILILVPSFLFFGPGQTLEKMENIKWVLYFFFRARARWSPIFSELLSRIECGQSKCVRACVCVRERKRFS